MKYIFSFFMLLVSAQCNAFEELKNILSYDKAPIGVVIEITSGDKLYLEKIITELNTDIQALRNKFSNISIAIVSHAKESLLLTEKEAIAHPGLHNKIKSLSESGDTTIHVCGTYASWFNVTEEEFPDYVNVSPAGPVQVDDYIELGYLHIEL